MQEKELIIKEFDVQENVSLYILPAERSRAIYIGTSVYDCFFIIQGKDNRTVGVLIGPKAESIKIRKLFTLELLRDAGLPLGDYSIYERKQSKELIKKITI